jgi:hypothetical protein
MYYNNNLYNQEEEEEEYNPETDYENLNGQYNDENFGLGSLKEFRYDDNTFIKQEEFYITTQNGKKYPVKAVELDCDEKSKFLNAFLYCIDDEYQKNLSLEQRYEYLNIKRYEFGDYYLSLFLEYFNQLSSRNDITIPDHIIKLFNTEFVNINNENYKPDIINLRVDNNTYKLLLKRLQDYDDNTKKTIIIVLRNYHYIIDSEHYSDSELLLNLLEYRFSCQIIYHTGAKNSVCQYTNNNNNNVIIIRKKKKNDIEQINSVSYDDNTIFQRNDDSNELIQDLLNYTCADTKVDKLLIKEQEQDINSSLNVIITFILLIIISIVVLLHGF